MIAKLVEHVLSNEHFPSPLACQLLAEMAELMHEIRVTKHPLGFVHFDLSALSGLADGGFARLHFWDRSLAAPDPAGNIHDHTWHLSSAVLFGGLRDRTYIPHGSPHGQYSAVRVRYGKTNVFEPAGRHELLPVADQTFSKGDIYRIKSRMVHESEPVHDPTITFVIGIPDAAAAVSGPLILSQSDQVSSATPVREVVSAREASHTLSLMRHLISD